MQNDLSFAVFISVGRPIKVSEHWGLVFDVSSK